MSNETHDNTTQAAGETPPEVALTAGPPRDTVVTFNQQYLSYFAGESAAFTADEAARLADLGVVGDGAATEAPVNVDVPHVSQAGDVLTCTMGNWTGAPTSYAYAWTIDGAAVGTDADSYTAAPEDVGKTAVCVVTATNAAGSTAAPPSIDVVVTGP